MTHKLKSTCFKALVVNLPKSTAQISILLSKQVATHTNTNLPVPQSQVARYRDKATNSKIGVRLPAEGEIFILATASRSNLELTQSRNKLIPGLIVRG